MAITKFGLNVSNLANITPPDLSSVIPTDGADAIDKIKNAPTVLGIPIALFTHIMLGSLAFMLYWILSDKLPLGEFKYSDLRAMFLSTAIASVIGVVMIEVGYLGSFKSLSFYAILSILFYVMLLKTEFKN